MIQKKLWALLCVGLLLFGACDVSISGLSSLRNRKLFSMEETKELRTRLSGGNTEHIIKTWRDLEYISENFENEEELLEYDYVLTADIVFPNKDTASLDEKGSYAKEGFIPIGTKEKPFTGSFNGNNFTIENLVIDRNDKDFVGLFANVQGSSEDGTVSEASLRNINLKNIKVTGEAKVGTLAGRVGEYVDVYNNRASGTVTGTSDVGGLIGNIIYTEGDHDTPTLSVTVQNSYANVNVTGTEHRVGGLVGSTSSSTVENSHATGKVEGASYVGGLIGYLFKKNADDKNEYIGAKKSYATGTVRGNNYVGGLIGRMISIPIQGARSKELIKLEASYATGDVTATNADGFNAQYTGGLVGEVEVGTIRNSYATGAVTGTNEVGGLVGEIDNESLIETSYARGEVEGTSKVGGLAGQLTFNSLVKTSYARGEVEGTSKVGGLVGELTFTSSVKTSYATGNVTGTTDIGGLIGAASVSPSIISSYATGNVSGNGDVKEHVGGLVGRVEERATIDTSYATGNVSGHEDIGGLIGVASESSVHTSYATGNVDGDINVGGFIGNMDATSTIENSYSTADVSRDINRRLFIGIKGNGMTTATTPSTNFVKGEDGVFMNVLLEDNGVGIDPVAGENGGVGENFTKENFTWIFEGENAMWHWLGNGKWPILKWQREAQGN